MAFRTLGNIIELLRVNFMHNTSFRSPSDESFIDLAKNRCHRNRPHTCKIAGYFFLWDKGYESLFQCCGYWPDIVILLNIKVNGALKNSGKVLMGSTGISGGVILVLFSSIDLMQTWDSVMIGKSIRS